MAQGQSNDYAVLAALMLEEWNWSPPITEFVAALRGSVTFAKRDAHIPAGFYRVNAEDVTPSDTLVVSFKTTYRCLSIDEL